jgi:hypothetical protein
MAISRFVPPLDYLKEASRSSLQSFELARLNHAANLRREIGMLMDQWITETSEAMLARWMLDQRAESRTPRIPTPDIFRTFFEDAPDPAKALEPDPPSIAPAPPRFANPRHPAPRAIASRTAKNGTNNAR